jgi:hypothetical protein
MGLIRKGANLMMADLELVRGLVELDRTSLRERALEMLRKAVTAREIEPGSRLVETELSAAMGISRGDGCRRRPVPQLTGPIRVAILPSTLLSSAG